VDFFIEHAGILPKGTDPFDTSNMAQNNPGHPFPRAAAPRYRNRFFMVTKAFYDANTAAVDGMSLGVKHIVASTGGAR
jgi:hypothetical protein